MAGWDWVRRRTPELILAALAGTMFLGCLGSPDLWGKREQRAVAETLDTVDHGNWLVARIQGRKRLEKPPLPRWTIASLIILTGRGDEWIFRLPGALSALGMVGLSYGMGRRLGGRTVGLAAGLVLTSTSFFIVEVRQAGNDAPLAFFVTLAIYAAYRRLHGEIPGTEAEADPPPMSPPGTHPGARYWAWLMYAALGCGFLTKGPVTLLLVAVALLPYLATVGRFRAGIRLLGDVPGAALLLFLMLCWPVPVLIQDPGAARLWYLEMAQKTASAGVKHLRTREYLPLEWPGMTAPWMVLGLMGAVLPFLNRGRSYRPVIWLAWYWALGNLAMFCFWKVAKPNYYLPCLPGLALLVGLEWVRLTRAAREPASRWCTWSRLTLQAHWVGLFLVAALAPVAAWHLKPAWTVGALVLSGLMMLGVVGSAWAWRRGVDGLALAPIVAAMSCGVVVGYAAIAPIENPRRSHRVLAETLDRVLPADAHAIYFFADLDEGLWFYLRDRELVPVPGSQPEYSVAMKYYEQVQNGTFKTSDKARLEDEKAILMSWLRDPERVNRYLMIRAKIYDRIAADLQGIATPLYREDDLDRNELVLLQIAPPEVVASVSPTPRLR